MACTRDIPHLSEGEMEDILYDFHKAQAMAMIEGNNNNSKLYTDAVLKKHGITQAEFDSSMIYYLRHTKYLRDIYKDITDRLNDDALAAGGVEGISSNIEYSAEGDTANIWRMNKCMMLTNHAPYDKTYFTIKADTSYHKGDTYIWDIRPIFLFQDGYRNLTVAMSLKYSNDSVQSIYKSVSYPEPLHLSLTSSSDLQVKSVSGFAYMRQQANNSRTTLQLIFLSGIRLLKMHPVAISNTDENKDNVHKSDSVEAAK